MAAFFQTTFSKAFCSLKMYKFYLNKISLTLVPKAPINNIPALVQIVAWCRPGDKPLSAPMVVSLLTHICVTWPQWVNSAPSHHLNQCWDIVNWTLMNKLQWNCIGNSNIFIQENAFQSVVCEMAAILSRPQCVRLLGMLSHVIESRDWVAIGSG